MKLSWNINGNDFKSFNVELQKQWKTVEISEKNRNVKIGTEINWEQQPENLGIKSIYSQKQFYNEQITSSILILFFKCLIASEFLLKTI